jgi:uncharacterized protein (TIGR02466 family)
VVDFVKPFGPSIMIDSVSEELVARLNRIGDRVLAEPAESARLDWSRHLAGNVHREFLVAFADEPERARALQEIQTKALAYYEHLRSERCVPLPEPIGPDGLRFEGMWMVSQLRGDFNPAHKHGGDFSGVVYLRVPDGLEAEWEAEGEGATAGHIEFIDGRASRFSRVGHRVRPRVGMLMLFPAWLLHTVYPFRSAGERRSLSFNIVLPHLAVALY